MKTNIEAYMKSGAYLPKPLRDFHDQKDVFKTMHRFIDPANASIKPVSWVDGQCYVIDVFLWFMARRGWTLQRSRTKLEFRDLNADIELRKKEEDEAFRQMMVSRSNASSNAKLNHGATGESK